VAVAAAAYNNNNDDPPVPPRRNHRKLEKRPSHEVIPDAYIIILNDNVMVNPETIAKEYGITIEYSYQHAIKGFSSRYVATDILDRMLEDSRIWAVGEDGNLEIDQEEEEDDEDGAAVVRMQQAAPQQLDQIDQSMDGIYSYSYTGAGVHIYVVDAGIMASHEDFGGRVATPCFDDIGPCNTDTDSHGTHIASTAGKLAFII
jgi:subtilisin family serine protease